MPLLKEGENIKGTYEVERFIGEGAFAEVYRVRHRILGRQAMKVFKRIGMKLKEVEDILQEAILLANINHPNIIRVYDADTIETSKGICCFFTMEYVAGGTLDRFWKSYGDKFVPVPTTVDIMKQVVSGLALSHSGNPPIVHRDIKPQNILVGYDDRGLRARIADFGLAKTFNLLTMALTGLGTRIFKPPEVLSNLKADSPAGDIWAVGTCFYLLLTDRFPFSDDFDIEDLGNEKFDQSLRAPSQLNISVDENLDQLVYRCLAIKVKDRFQNAMDLKEVLDAWTPGKRKRKSKSVDMAQFSDVSKSALGTRSTPDKHLAMKMTKEAIKMARYVGKLNEAADLMEEAFNKWPELREKYKFKVTIWRKGISG